MIEVCSLSSGSNGNCFYIRTGDKRFLVDAGISCKQIALRLQQVGSDASWIDGIFITHEHSDHIRGLRVFMNRFPTKIYVSEKTFWRMNLEVEPGYLHFIQSDDQLTIDNTTIRALPKSHDAVDPSLFYFVYNEKKISIITDAGYVCRNVIRAVADAHILFIESNYDRQMLQNGYYPAYLKARIEGAYGHLSNTQAAELVLQHGSPHLSHVFLSHLSENNNSPGIAMNTFKAIIKERSDLKRLKPLVASRQEVSQLVKLPLSGSRSTAGMQQRSLF